MLNANTPANKVTITIGFHKFVIHHHQRFHTSPQLVGTEDSRSGTLNLALNTALKPIPKILTLYAFHHSVTILLLVAKTLL
jgi:hypothetical protein